MALESFRDKGEAGCVREALIGQWNEQIAQTSDELVVYALISDVSALTFAL